MRRPENKPEAGFSLVELLIAAVVLMIVVGILGTVVGGVQRSYGTYRDRAARISEATVAMSILTKTIQNAGNNTTAVELTPTSTNRLRVKGDWNPADGALNDAFEDVEFFVSAGTLTMIDYSSGTAVTSPVSDGVDSIYFQYFDANGTATTVMADVFSVRVTLTVDPANPRTLVSQAALRKKIQLK